MTTINATIPDSLFRHVKSIAEREDITIEHFIALALAGQVSSWETAQEFERRAKRGNWKRALEILDKAPDVEPIPEDRID
jgi:hypothetical protein